MKTKLTLVFLFILSLGVYGQKKLEPLEIIYDFNKNYTKSNVRPRHGQAVIFKITNINRLANNVYIKSVDSLVTNNIDESDIAKSRSIIQGGKMEEKTFQKSDVKFSSINLLDKKEEKTIKSPNKEIEDLTNELKKSSNLKIAKEKELLFIKNDNRKLSDNLEKKLKNTESKQDTLKVVINNKSKKDSLEIEKNEKKIIEIEVDIKYLISVIDDLKEKIRELNYKELDNYKKINELMEKYNMVFNYVSIFNKINNSYNNYINFIQTPILTFDLYSHNFESYAIIKKENVSEYYTNLRNFETSYCDFIKQFNENTILLYDIAKENGTEDAKLIGEQSQALKTEVEKIYSYVNDLDIRTKINDADFIHNMMTKDSGLFEVTSSPIQPFEDILKFNVKIENINNGLSKNTTKNIEYMEYVSGGVRWDFSVGTVFDFGIKNQSFELQKVNDSISKIIPNNNSAYKTTIAGILHTSLRSYKMVTVGLSLGTSIDLTDLKINSFFPGISLMIGKKEKFILTVGPSFKNVKQLKSKFSDVSGDPYNTVLNSDAVQETDLVTDTYKMGWFFGISYNLTNKQKSKFKVQ